MPSLKETLIEDYGDDAPREFALGLSRGNRDTFKQGYSPANSILAMKEMFPDVDEDKETAIRNEIVERINSGEFNAPMLP